VLQLLAADTGFLRQAHMVAGDKAVRAGLEDEAAAVHFRELYTQ
jgi:hypothetical protein